MGFALTTCFTNIYQCVTHLDNLFSSYGTLILLAQGFSFVSLISLFYLGTERLLDNRYLRTDSRVPKPSGLLLDLFTFGMTAIWFVILADTFPNIQPNGNQLNSEDLVTALGNNLKFFTLNLFLLYFFDSIFIIVQMVRTYRHRDKAGAFKVLIAHHGFWLCVNIISAILFFPILLHFNHIPIVESVTSILPTGIVTIIMPLYFNFVRLSYFIILVHVIRFIVDYWVAFESYYPDVEFVSLPPAV